MKRKKCWFSWCGAKCGNLAASIKFGLCRKHTKQMKQDVAEGRRKKLKEQMWLRITHDPNEIPF